MNRAVPEGRALREPASWDWFRPSPGGRTVRGAERNFRRGRRTTVPQAWTRARQTTTAIAFRNLPETTVWKVPGPAPDLRAARQQPGCGRRDSFVESGIAAIAVRGEGATATKSAATKIEMQSVRVNGYGVHERCSLKAEARLRTRHQGDVSES